MTRLEIARLWVKGSLTEEEVRIEMAKTEHPVRMNYDPLYEADSYWEGEEENTSMVVGLELAMMYGEEKSDEFMKKFWPNEIVVKYDPRGNLIK